MGRGNIVYHNLRMNLDNEQHRRVHLVLSDLNTDIHKSVNQFLIDAADSYISRLAGEGLTWDEGKEPGECKYATRDDLERVHREIKDELQREMIAMLGSALMGGQARQMPGMGMEKAGAADVGESVVDATTVGLASTWG